MPEDGIRISALREAKEREQMLRKQGGTGADVHPDVVDVQPSVSLPSVMPDLPALLDKQITDLERDIAEKTILLNTLKAMRQNGAPPVVFDGKSFTLLKGQ